MNSKNILLIILFAAFVCPQSQGTAEISVESASTWQTRNDQRVPGEGGDKFSLADIDSGPFLTYRIYAGYTFNQKHEVRALYAPLEIKTKGELPNSVLFNETTFAANTPTEAKYKFNSYRVTYAYHFQDQGEWSYALGFTAKIRDAEVKLTQNSLSDKKSNVGFVPLLHVQAARSLGTNWRFRFDFDGLAAPQGRAVDMALFFERNLGSPDLAGFFGYRTVEGGADNDKVYNFAWIHYATIGFRGWFGR